jgi:hypothetical protein
MTKPTHPVELLASAIATQEGWFSSDPTVLPRVLNNPGDLDFADQLNATANGRCAEFPYASMGVTALFRQLWEQVAMGQTVRQIIAQWAPPNENNTSVYLQNVLTWTGLPADTPMLDLLPQLYKMD